MTDQLAPAPEVLVRREGAVTRITLNRPKVINALNRSMVTAIETAVRGANLDGSRAVLLDGAGERGFCGGGDVKAMVAGGPEGTLSFLRNEYRADFAVHASAIPVVGIMDGVTMGGGIGLTGHSSLRVVTERSRLAMPETRIGIVPDVGGNLLLARSPGRLGELLSITSGSMTAGDAIALGFADVYLPSERLAELAEGLIAGEDPGAVATSLAEPAPESQLLDARAWFDPIAERALGTPDATLEDPAAAAVRLIGELEASADAPARALAETVRRMCPTSVAVSLAQLARIRRDGLELAAVLHDDYRVLARLTRRQDFAEGVRAQLIEKDGAPVWRPATIESVDSQEVARVLDPSSDSGVEPLVLG